MEEQSFEPIELSVDEQEEHDQLGLPNTPPHLFSQALLQQLARLPLIEEAHAVAAA